MIRRSPKSQSAHDPEVRKIAKDFQRKGFQVKADHVEDFSPPDTIGGVRPDVVATKGNLTKIVEVETTESVKTARDQNQQEAFRTAAKQDPNTTFTRRVVKP